MVATQDGAQEEAEEESVPASEEDGDNAAQEEAEEESVPASEEDGDNAAQEVAEEESAPASEEDGDNAAQEEAEEAAQEEAGLGSEEKMVRVDEPVTDEGSNHSDDEAGPVIEFVRDEEEEEEVVVARTASVGECKNQYAKALALIQEARDHSQVLALERYISQNIHNLKRGGDMESLFFALSNVKLRDKVQVYNLRFEQSACPPSLKQDALLDLPILLYTYFRYQLNEEPDGSRERILVSDTRTVLTSIAFHLAINVLLPQLDPRAVGQAKLKENGISRSAYVEQCKFFSEKVFDLFVDDEMFSAAFPNEPKECLRKLTTDLFAERSDSCFDVPKLRKATEVHTPAKLIQLMNRYLDGSEDEDEGEEQYADEDEDEDESPARRRHPRDGSPSAEEDATDGENASSREEDKGQAGMDEEDFGPGPSYQVDDSDQEAWHGHSGGGKGRQVLHDSDNDDDDDEEDQDDDEKGLSSKRGSHKNTKKSAEKGRGSTEKHAAAASETPVPGRRKRARHDWTKKETRALIKGIEMFYNDTMKWAKIKKDKKLGPILLARTNGDLKDKFRSMRDSGKYDFSEFSSYLDVTPKQNKRLKCGPN